MKISFSVILLLSYFTFFCQTQEGCPPSYDFQQSYTFSNGQTIDICGELVDSKSGETSFYSILIKDKTNTYLEIDDYYVHLLEFKGDHILIKQEIFFPDLENCSNWRSRINSIQKIYTTKNGIVTEDAKPVFDKESISQSDIDLTIRNANRLDGFDTEWECLIGKLEFLALNGNEQATYLLLNLEDILHDTSDGALAEYLKDAQANVEWHLKK